MLMKLVMIYNSNCVSCLPYIQDVQKCVSEISLDFECIDINIDIFNSIHHIVNCRISVDKHINQLPLIIVYDSSGAKHAIVGIVSYEELTSKLKGMIL